MDEILSLPVQNPPTLEFSASDIVWSKVEGWRDNLDRLALIPFARVDDFVRGESANKDCPTRFHVASSTQTSYKQKVCAEAERSIRRSTYELDTDDAVSINLWVESHQNQVFFFEDFSDSEPFTLGIQTEWQLQQMIRFGNRGLVASDSRFGTNKLKILNLSKDLGLAVKIECVVDKGMILQDTGKTMGKWFNILAKSIEDPDSDVIENVDVQKSLTSLIEIAVAVQKQLDGIVNFDSRQANVDTLRKSANHDAGVCGTNSSNQDKELVNENYHIEKDDCQERDIHEISRGVTNSNQSAVDATQKQARDSLEQQMSGTNLSNQARELANESDCMDKDVSSLNRNDHQVRHEASGSHRDDFVDGVGEQVACSQMDIDPPTTCISLPGLLSVNEIASNESFENGDRIINAVSDMSKSPHDVSTDQVRHEHNSVMDVRPLSNDILPSVESMEQCAVTNQNVPHYKDPKPLVSTNTEDASTDNEMMKPESEGGSRTESHRCDDNALGVCDNKAGNSNLHQVVEAADSLNSESSPRSSSISRCIEEQLSGKVETEGAGSFKKPSRSDKLVFTRRTRQKRVANDKSDN
uniref:Uncharacterized protein n=1 Tax=Salix viminalis TaxID=40686 RepID=A0A6N2MRY4_SALVM